jgi:YfiH family protein
VFFKDTRNVYRSGGLASFAWLEHGFATRDSLDWPDPWRLVMLKQIHSDHIERVDGGRGYFGEGDALVTDRPGVLIGVRTADCVPILIADPEHRAVAAVHAGWRGTVEDIAAKAVSRLTNEYGSKPEDLHAALGPSIGPCCYEVGPEVAARFRPWVSDLTAGKKTHLDLIEVNQRQLTQAGLNPANIYAGSPCTNCGPAELHSYRRDGPKAGRMIAAIGVL